MIGTEKRSLPALQERITTGVFLIILILCLTWVGSWPFTVFSVIIGGLVFYEWSRMVRPKTMYAFLSSGWEGYSFIGLLLLLDYPLWITFIMILAIVIYLMICKGLKDKENNYIENGWIAGGFLYAALFAVVLVRICKQELYGFSILCFLYAVVWGTDTGAYFLGCLMGKRKLAPVFSPNKTRIGALGGIFLGCTCGFFTAWFLGTPWENKYIFILASLISVFSQVGDIAESAIKRRFNVKDSGTLLPGHGGVMDRVDGLITASIFLYAVGLLDGTFDIF